jgi:hypothetical protein
MVVITWARGAWATTAGTAEPTRIDAAALSARMAGMTVTRPMRMIPPRCLQRSVACYAIPSSSLAHLTNVELLPLCGLSCT